MAIGHLATCAPRLTAQIAITAQRIAISGLEHPLESCLGYDETSAKPDRRNLTAAGGFVGSIAPNPEHLRRLLDCERLARHLDAPKVLDSYPNAK